MLHPLEPRRLCAAFPDFNGDRTADVRDFTILADNFNGTGKTFAQGDASGDGTVDLSDFTILAAHFNETSDPAPDFIVHAGEKIQPAIDAAPVGATIALDAGATYDESLSINKDITLDGNGATLVNPTRSTAMTLAHGMVRDLTFDGCANQLQTYRAGVRLGDGATLQDVTVQHFDATGIGVFGHDDTLLRVTAQDNGEAGIGGDHCSYALVKDCITQRNNRGLVSPVWAGAGTVGGYTTAVKRPDGKWYVDPDFEAGGGKWWATDHVTIEHLQAYDNGAPGIWFDYQNSDVVVRDSIIYGNVGWQVWHATGIRLELSDAAHGRYTITGNTVTGHAGGNISVEQVEGATIRGNTLTSGIGVLVRDYDRGAQYRVASVDISGNTFNQCNVTWWEHPFGTSGVSVHDNVFVV